MARSALAFPVLAVLVACSAAEAEEAGPGRQAAEHPPEAERPAEPTKEAAAPSPEKAPAKIVYLQPLGKQLSTEAVQVVETGLREFYGFEVRTEPVRPLPRWAYYAPRKRYRAEKLLRYLSQLRFEDAYRVLGLTGVDISTTKGRIRDWGIMGLATIDGRNSVMSMFRCRRGSSSELHARERLGKVAVHEVGHTLGLEHCPTRGCLMEDARGTNTTTDREHLICDRCRRLLGARGYHLPPNPRPPWREPGSF